MFSNNGFNRAAACLVLSAAILACSRGADLQHASMCGLKQAEADWTTNEELERCAAEGNLPAQALLGMLYWGASDTEICDDSGCTIGDPTSAGFDESIDAETLRAEGRRLIETAARQGDVQAQNELGLAFFLGLYGVESDPVSARHWLEAAVKGGDKIAPYNLARIHFSGQGAPRSVSETERYLRISASRGYKGGKCSLALLLERRPNAASAVAEARRLRQSVAINDHGSCQIADYMPELQ